MPLHGPLFDDYAEKNSDHQFSLQNKKLLKVNMAQGPVWARTGSMVAYQGQISFTNRGSGGIGKFLKQAATGEGVQLMEASGSGELFLADEAADIQLLYLDNDVISVNGGNVLAFSQSIQWDVRRIQARGAAMTGGLYNVELRGTGFVAITTKGEPVALDVAQAPTFADAQAVVLWTGGVQMDIKVDTGGVKSMLRGGTGEMLQMAFRGQGHVVVQPCENVVATPNGGGGGAGSALGGLFD